MAIEFAPSRDRYSRRVGRLCRMRVPGTIEVERAATAHLAKHKDNPVTPFRPRKLHRCPKTQLQAIWIAKALREVFDQGRDRAPPSTHLVVTDAGCALPASRDQLSFR